MAPWISNLTSMPQFPYLCMELTLVTVSQGCYKDYTRDFIKAD